MATQNIYSQTLEEIKKLETELFEVCRGNRAFLRTYFQESISKIFGLSGQTSWLDAARSNSQCFSAVCRFLHPTGAFMCTIYNFLDQKNLYNFPIKHLPPTIQAKIRAKDFSSLSMIFPRKSDSLIGQPTSDTVAVDMFSYFMLWLAASCFGTNFLPHTTAVTGVGGSGGAPVLGGTTAGSTFGGPTGAPVASSMGGGGLSFGGANRSPAQTGFAPSVAGFGALDRAKKLLSVGVGARHDSTDPLVVIIRDLIKFLHPKSLYPIEVPPLSNYATSAASVSQAPSLMSSLSGLASPKAALPFPSSTTPELAAEKQRLEAIERESKESWKRLRDQSHVRAVAVHALVDMLLYENSLEDVVFSQESGVFSPKFLDACDKNAPIFPCLREVMSVLILDTDLPFLPNREVPPTQFPYMGFGSPSSSSLRELPFYEAVMKDVRARAMRGCYLLLRACFRAWPYYVAHPLSQVVSLWTRLMRPWGANPSVDSTFNIKGYVRAHHSLYTTVLSDFLSFAQSAHCLLDSPAHAQYLLDVLNCMSDFRIRDQLLENEKVLSNPVPHPDVAKIVMEGLAVVSQPIGKIDCWAILLSRVPDSPARELPTKIACAALAASQGNVMLALVGGDKDQVISKATQITKLMCSLFNFTQDELQDMVRKEKEKSEKRAADFRTPQIYAERDSSGRLTEQGRRQILDGTHKPSLPAMYRAQPAKGPITLLNTITAALPPAADIHVRIAISFFIILVVWAFLSSLGLFRMGLILALVVYGWMSVSEPVKNGLRILKNSLILRIATAGGFILLVVLACVAANEPVLGAVLTVLLLMSYAIGELSFYEAKKD